MTKRCLHLMLGVLCPFVLSSCSSPKEKGQDVSPQKNHHYAVHGLDATFIAEDKPWQTIVPLLKNEKPDAQYTAFTIKYPFHESVFPPEISAPTFRWEDTKSGSDIWLIKIQFKDTDEQINVLSSEPYWKPSRQLWATIKKLSVDKPAVVTILGTQTKDLKQFRSKQQVTFFTSKDQVGAPIFYREVPLPFIFAVNNMRLIRWRMGDVSLEDSPPVVLKSMPVCGNCHSFTPDGKLMGMDADYANDKGGYVIAPVSEEILLTRNNIISWSDYRRQDGEVTFGLLSQISPDRKYAISTVKDRSVFVPVDDPWFSQLFFPIKGILAWYSLETRTFDALPGADDRDFVQSNPSWTPDGKYVVFARAKRERMPIIENKKNVLLTKEECKAFLADKRKFQFDLYRVPFNNGKGGKAEPVPGASNNGFSNFFARFSPDGKWMVFTRARSYMLLQRDSELYIMPAEGGTPRRMRCNTTRMNSWHSWSPNGKWIVFSSKVFTPYTQFFLTHVDENGNDTPPVLLENFTSSDTAGNIPEFVNVKPGAIRTITERFIDDYSYTREGVRLLTLYQEFRRAEEEFTAALKLNPNNKEVHVNLGAIYYRTGRFPKALEQFDQALKLDPNLAIAHFNRGQVFLETEKYDKAIEAFKTALRLDPNDPKVHVNLGRAFMLAQATQDAQREFQTHIDKYPKDADGYIAMAELFAMNPNSYQQAMASVQKGLQLDPRHLAGLILLGNLHNRAGQLDLAIPAFEKALAVNPKVPGLKDMIEKLKAKQKAK